MNTKDEIRLTLIDLMDAQQITGNELAEAVGVSKQAVSAWRMGKSSIDIENVPAICRFLGVSIDDFFGGSEGDMSQKLTDEEREVVEALRAADENGRQAILAVARAVNVKGE